ncbi:hypothetical protein DFH09DRAFT_1269734 [Mycena vulgaris]|nr:hypothetical protein DFH09DRAFT_1269734 [Mycena vulgaris]
MSEAARNYRGVFSRLWLCYFTAPEIVILETAAGKEPAEKNQQPHDDGRTDSLRVRVRPWHLAQLRHNTLPNPAVCLALRELIEAAENRLETLSYLLDSLRYRRSAASWNPLNPATPAPDDSLRLPTLLSCGPVLLKILPYLSSPNLVHLHIRDDRLRSDLRPFGDFLARSRGSITSLTIEDILLDIPKSESLTGPVSRFGIQLTPLKKPG